MRQLMKKSIRINYWYMFDACYKPCVMPLNEIQEYFSTTSNVSLLACIFKRVVSTKKRKYEARLQDFLCLKRRYVSTIGEALYVEFDK